MEVILSKLYLCHKNSFVDVIKFRASFFVHSGHFSMQHIKM